MLLRHSCDRSFLASPEKDLLNSVVWIVQPAFIQHKSRLITTAPAPATTVPAACQQQGEAEQPYQQDAYEFLHDHHRLSLALYIEASIKRNQYRIDYDRRTFLSILFDGLVRTPHMVVWQNKVGLYISLNITTIFVSAKPVLSPT